MQKPTFFDAATEQLSQPFAQRVDGIAWDEILLRAKLPNEAKTAFEKKELVGPPTHDQQS